VTVQRQIGFWTAVSLVMGNMIGSGVFLLPASLAPFGGLSLVGWLISAGGSIMLALVFARLARLNPAAGGPYAFTRAAFGDLAGFLVGWGYWISVWCANGALAVALVGYLDPFIPSLVRHRPTAAVLAIGFVWLLTAVNIAGIHRAGRVQVVTTTLKILPLVLVGVGGLMWLEPSHFAVPPPEVRASTGGVLAVVTLTLWAFLGLESGTVPASATANPERTIPRATIAGTSIAAALYIGSTAGVMGLIPPDVLASTTAPFAEAARVLAGDGAALAVAAGAAISCFGALNGWILIVGQLPMAIANDGLFPRLFSRLSRYGTPAPAMIVGGLLTTTLIAFNASSELVALFTKMILLSTLSTLVPYTFCSLAGFLMPARGSSPGAMSRGAAVIAALAFLYAVVAIGGAGQEVVYLGFLLLIGGLPVYVWVTRRRRLAAAP
jgi:APA family basic amino acid/polyamine antiporter